jgi:hypothetical protein
MAKWKTGAHGSRSSMFCCRIQQRHVHAPTCKGGDFGRKPQIAHRRSPISTARNTIDHRHVVHAHTSSNQSFKYRITVFFSIYSLQPRVYARTIQSLEKSYAISISITMILYLFIFYNRIDDPGIWGALLPLHSYNVSVRNMRWTLAAQELCYKNACAEFKSLFSQKIIIIMMYQRNVDN